MDAALFVMSVLTPVVAARMVRPAHPVTAAAGAVAAAWLLFAAELIPLPLLWRGVYGNFYWIACLAVLPPAWLAAACACLVRGPRWRAVLLPTVLWAVPAFLVPYVCQEVFRRGFEFLAPALLLALAPLLRAAWRRH